MGAGASSRTAPINGVEQVDSMIANDFRIKLATTLVRNLITRRERVNGALSEDDKAVINVEVQSLIREYLIFIWLRKLYPLQTMVASKYVDIVWHQHILYTREYAQFCKRNLGSFLHHTPKLPSTGSTSDKSNPTYTKLLIRYRYHTKLEPPRQFWPQSKELKAQEIALKRQMIEDGSYVRFWDDEISKPKPSTQKQQTKPRSSSASSYIYGGSSSDGADLAAAII